MSTATAWPFLIARGRRRGYTVLAAPGFLVRDGEEGFLEEVVGPAPDPVATREVRSPRGRRLCLAWADHRVRGGEVGEAADPVDEHSRPLRLLHGYLCPDAPLGAPAPADLDRSLAAALATYRRFLRDEDAFTVEESTPFPVATRAVVPTPPSHAPRPAGLLVTATVVTLLAVLTGLWLVPGDEQPSVTLDRTVRGTIETTGQQDTYALDTGPATAITLRGDNPPSLTVALRDPDTGTTLIADLTGCWPVTANTTYQLTVTSAAGDYTFRLDSSKGCTVTRDGPTG